jgi:hypothetical protein
MQKIAILYDASQVVLSTFDLDELLQQILIIARDYFHLKNVAVYLLDTETQELYPRRQIGWEEGYDSGRLRVGVGIPGSGRAAEAAPLCPRHAAGCALSFLE